jgi:ATP-dependent Clp protease ATP-binding subunit ClpC
MELFPDNKLDPGLFESNIRHGTHDLNDVLTCALYSQSPAVESTHFLVALARIGDGITRRSLDRIGLSLKSWETGLGQYTERSPDAVPPAQLTRAAMHPNALEMLRQVAERCDREKLSLVPESILLLCALRNVPPPILGLFTAAKLDHKALCLEIEESLQPVQAVSPLIEDDPHSLNRDVFSGGARNVLRLMQTEAAALGYQQIDARHLLLALVEREKGVTQYALFHQGVVPRRVQEALTVNLRGGARRHRDPDSLDRATLQPLLQRMLIHAGELAGRARAKRITEAHLLCGFLSIDSSARRILEDQKSDINSVRRIAEDYDVVDEEEDDEAMADIQIVRERLKRRLVGQDDAIDQILPYVQTMRFGFSTPGKPVGTFLFCGQSGSGKTEMAKELARAIYGSEENLIFLEMGQFNSPESMNIFVGAPPGYVGYGEGKLTNGLRDKPRAVVLFDEVEKAHAKVLDALLRFLDEGRIDDPAGPVRDGSQCLLILTSNVGAEQLTKLGARLTGDGSGQARARKALVEEFKKAGARIEFLNRIDELILFRTLSESDYTVIAERLLQKDADRLAKEARIHISDWTGVAGAIGRYCFAAGEGARHAQRLVRKVLVTPAIDYVIKQSLPRPAWLKLSAELPRFAGDDGLGSLVEPVGRVSRSHPPEPASTRPGGSGKGQNER